MMSSHEHTLQSLKVRLENLENDKLGYEDELEYALQAPYGTNSDTMEAVADSEANIENVNEDIDLVKSEIESMQEG